MNHQEINVTPEEEEAWASFPPSLSIGVSAEADKARRYQAEEYIRSEIIRKTNVKNAIVLTRAFHTTEEISDLATALVGHLTGMKEANYRIGGHLYYITTALYTLIEECDGNK